MEGGRGMKIVEEKKLVAEKLMGWYIQCFGEEYATILDGKRGANKLFDNWSPQKDPRCWPEIWGKMDENQIQSYCKNIEKSCIDIELPYAKEYHFHTVPPQTRWAALIKTLFFLYSS